MLTFCRIKQRCCILPLRGACALGWSQELSQGLVRRERRVSCNVLLWEYFSHHLLWLPSLRFSKADIL